MTHKEILKRFGIPCKKAMTKNEVACPFRSISNDYCEEYETIKRDLDRLEIFEDIIRKYCYIKKYNDHKEITMSLSDYDEEEKCYLNFLEKILKTYEDNKYYDK